MFSKVKSIFGEIKTDIDKKIEHLEVDTNKIRTKTTRLPQRYVLYTGIDFLEKKYNDFEDIETCARLNENNVELAIELLKRGLFEATRLMTNVDNFSKEFKALVTTIESVKLKIDIVQNLCKEVNDIFNNLENEYEEAQLKEKLNEIEFEFENYCFEKKKQTELQLVTSNEEMEKFLADESDDIPIKSSGLSVDGTSGDTF